MLLILTVVCAFDDIMLDDDDDVDVEDVVDDVDVDDEDNRFIVTKFILYIDANADAGANVGV